MIQNIHLSHPEITSEELVNTSQRRDIFRGIFQELWYIYSSPFEMSIEKIQHWETLSFEEYQALENIFWDENFLRKAHEFFQYKIIFQWSQHALKKININLETVLEKILFQGFLLMIKQRVFDTTSEHIVCKNEIISLYKNKETYFLSSWNGALVKEYQWANLFSLEKGILFLQEKNVWKKFNLCGDLVDKNTYDFLITAHFNQTGYIKTRQNGVEKLISIMWVEKHAAKNQSLCYDEKVGQFYHYDPTFPKEKDYIANQK